MSITYTLPTNTNERIDFENSDCGIYVEGGTTLNISAIKFTNTQCSFVSNSAQYVIGKPLRVPCEDKTYIVTDSLNIPTPIVERCIVTDETPSEPPPNGKGITEPPSTEKETNGITEPISTGNTNELTDPLAGKAPNIPIDSLPGDATPCCPLPKYRYNSTTKKCEDLNGNITDSAEVCPAPPSFVKRVGYTKNIYVSSNDTTKINNNEIRCCPLDGYYYSGGKCIDGKGNQTDLVRNNYYGGTNLNGNDVCVPYCYGGKERIFECDNTNSLMMICNTNR